MIRRFGVIRALLLVAGGIVSSLLLIEGGLRALPQYLPRDVRLALDLSRHRIALDCTAEEDPELSSKLKPNSDVLIEGHPDYRYHVRTYLNFPDAGFRGNVVPRPLVGVAVGDSFTFGVGVEAEEAWPEQLSQLAGRNFANLGVFGYGPPQYTRVLKRYGLRMIPKIVLYTIYLENDLIDADDFVRWQQEGRQHRASSIGKSRFLARHSRLYQLLVAPRLDGRFAEAVARKNALRVTVRKQPFRRLNIAWEAVQQAVLSARQLTQQNGAALVLVLVPSKIQAYRHLLRMPFAPQELYHLDEYNGQVMQLCEEHQIKCLDLAPRFEERTLAGEQLYFRMDGHWNAAGHRLAAHTIYDYLVNNGLLDGRER